MVEPYLTEAPFYFAKYIQNQQVGPTKKDTI